MTKPPRTCSRCGTPDLTSWCPVCTEAWDNRRDVDDMTPEERAAEFEAWGGPLEIEFAKLHERIEELVGRPVMAHELGTSGVAYLTHEILTGQRPTLEGILAKLPEHMRVIRVAVGDSSDA